MFFKLKNKIGYMSMLFIVTMCSCSNNSTLDITSDIINAPSMNYAKSSPLELDITKVDNISIKDFENLIDTIKYIPLDEKEIVGDISDIIIGNDRMYVLDTSLKKIFVYDLSGRLIKCINSRGHANNEFLLPCAIFFDNKHLVVKDGQQLKFLYYDKDGKYIKTTKSIASLYGVKQGKYFINQLAMGQSYDRDINYHMVSTVEDSVCSKGLLFDPIQVNSLESDRLRYNSKKELLFQPSLTDTVYSINSKDEYSAKYYIKHQNSIWQKSKESLSYDNISEFLRRGYTEVHHFFDVDNYSIMSISKYDKRTKYLCNQYLLYDKNNKKALNLENPTSGTINKICPITLIATHDNICISSINPNRLKYSLIKKSKIKLTDKQLSDIVMNSSENTNPVIVLFTFK